MPGATEAARSLQDDKVPALITFDEVDGGALAAELTHDPSSEKCMRADHARYPRPDYHHGGIGVISVPDWNLRIRLISGHVGGVLSV